MPTINSSSVSEPLLRLRTLQGEQAKTCVEMSHLRRGLRTDQLRYARGVVIRRRVRRRRRWDGRALEHKHGRQLLLCDAVAS